MGTGLECVCVCARVREGETLCVCVCKYSLCVSACFHCMTEIEYVCTFESESDR